MSTSGTAAGAGPAWPVARAARTRLVAPLLVGAPLLAATGYVAAVDPAKPGHYPACPILLGTGLFCPGCGGLRALHDLTHGDVLAALGHNAYGVLFVLAGALLWLSWFVSRLRRRPVQQRLVLIVSVTMLVLAPAFMVVRNLPFGQLLAP